MIKVFSKCLVVLFGLMLFFGNNDSCYGMKRVKNTGEPKQYTNAPENDHHLEESKGFIKEIYDMVLLVSFMTPEYTFLMTDFMKRFPIIFSVIFIRRLIFGGALGHNIYKKIGNGNFHIYTSNLPSFLKFMHTGISYKINEMVYFNLIEFNFISFIGCGILGQAVSSVNLTIFNFDKSIGEKFFAFVFLLKRGCHFAVLSICFYKYFCLNIDILGSFVDYGINKFAYSVKQGEIHFFKKKCIDEIDVNNPYFKIKTFNQEEEEESDPQK